MCCYLYSVPVVTVVVEGGKDTIANVTYDLRENVPVVLINVSISKAGLLSDTHTHFCYSQGSGRAADFLNRWLLYTKDHDFRSYYPETVYGIDQLDRADDGSQDSKDIPNTKLHSSSRYIKLCSSSDYFIKCSSNGTSRKIDIIQKNK